MQTFDISNLGISNLQNTDPTEKLTCCKKERLVTCRRSCRWLAGRNGIIVTWDAGTALPRTPSTSGCVSSKTFTTYHDNLAVAAQHQGATGQVTWLEDPLPWLKPWVNPCLRPACYFASVIVITENKNVTISDRFVLFWRWNGVGGQCFEGDS